MLLRRNRQPLCHLQILVLAAVSFSTHSEIFSLRTFWSWSFARALLSFQPQQHARASRFWQWITIPVDPRANMFCALILLTLLLLQNCLTSSKPSGAGWHCCSSLHPVALLAASVARERKLLKWARKGFKIPVPLRSRLCPDMLPGLTGWNKAKVELANQLYAQVTRISIFAVFLGVLVVIENPASSLYWCSTSFFLELAAFCAGHNVDFHSCCHGGQRPKLTRFWVSQEVFSQLSLFCDGTRWHKPWTPRGVGNRLHFVTADEAAYPLLLCQRTIDALLELCFPGLDMSVLRQSAIPFDSKATRVSLGFQPRGKTMGPLVAEFSHQVAEARKQVGIDSFLRSMPKGSKVVRQRLLDGGSVIPSLVHATEVTFHEIPDFRLCD